MARPKAVILLETRERGTYMLEQVTEASDMFAVYHCGKPFRLRYCSYAREAYYYKPTTFTNNTYAIRLADRLNKKFFTDVFTTVRLGVIEDE